MALSVAPVLLLPSASGPAEDLSQDVEIIRTEFGKGNDFVSKITYKATGRKTDDLIQAFRNSPSPRIAVTVDMIATGTDVKPLECVFFMRSVRSRTYFEQMTGRGVRVISDTDLQAVVPGATSKERFVIVDAVGVTEAELQETPPLDRQYFRSVYFREPGGVLFELATDAPGFLVDEPFEGLGATLKLPPQYERMRGDLERVLPPIDLDAALRAAPASAHESAFHGLPGDSA